VPVSEGYTSACLSVPNVKSWVAELSVCPFP